MVKERSNVIPLQESEKAKSELDWVQLQLFSNLFLPQLLDIKTDALKKFQDYKAVEKIFKQKANLNWLNL